ncbi:CysS/YqeB C-terminal domain-containing protein [Rheinheimera sp.]|uniref:CysS/YqeB C-terminal domain-containing protein n=1 Tax=Rheinheimera sp. TaxID=1869214 RepID=UPI0040485AED
MSPTPLPSLPFDPVALCAARANKDWAAADAARDALTAKGIIVEDKNGVTSWRKG